MRVNGIVFGILFVFFIIVGNIYWFTSGDPTGTTALAFAAGLGGLIAYYLLFTTRRLAPQPEDLADADISDGAGELGFFSPHSIWPILVAASVALICLGLIFGWWLVVIGIAFLLPGLYGLLFEYYRRPVEETHSN